MKFRLRWLPAFLLFALIPAHAQSYSSELQLGVTAYKASHYEEAIIRFRKATELDPAQPIAHMYLATACASQYIPGVDTPDNLRFAEEGIEQYEVVLNSSAVLDSRINSAKGIAYLYLNMKKFDEAKKYYRIASDFDGKDPETHYSIGVIDWTMCYQPRMEARAKLGMRPEEHLDAANPDQETVCEKLKIQNEALIEDGIDNFNKAIQLRPDYDDAMAYMNLIYRERADLECDDPVSRERDLKTADEWVDKTLAVKKAKASKRAEKNQSAQEN